jgi:hypothetical protein
MCRTKSKGVKEVRGDEVYLDESLTATAFSFAGQGALKHLLTEGDKMFSVVMVSSEV